MNPSTPMFLAGLAIGTTLLLLGLLLGIWIGRRMAPPQVVDDSLERAQMLRFVRNFASITSDFAGDFSAYQAEFESLSKRANESGKKPSAEEVQALLSRITAANNELKAQLEAAENRIETQTKELAGYLTEARTDGLTGLSNRRAFDHKMDERMQRWKTSKKPFCLVLIDIDFFKKINDTFGHPAGDVVLKDLAAQLRTLQGEGIDVARYGGEEFAILADLTIESTAQRIDDFRKSVQARIVEAEGVSIPITISCGVSKIGPDERLGILVRRSDEALYAAKMGGRNRLYIHDGTICRPFGNPGPPLQSKPSAPQMLPHSEGAPAPGAATLDELDSTASTVDDSNSSGPETVGNRLQRRLEKLLADESRRTV
jgi:diguanylate cyclase